MSRSDDHQYVHRVRDETQRYIHDLREENRALRAAVQAAEEECRRLRALADATSVETMQLGRRLEREQAEKERLLRRIAGVEEESRRVSDRYAEVERRNNDLASLYVASYQLHGSVDREEILAAIQEILINLIGTEDFAIFGIGADGRLLRLASFGEREDGVPSDHPQVHEVMASGAIEIDEASAAGDSERLVAVIPLHLAERVTGVIAVRSLLPQKAGTLGELDRELCELLSRQAASAIYCASLDPARFSEAVAAS